MSTERFALSSAEKLAGWLILVGMVVYLTLFAFNTMTRTGSFTPDSMNYVNVARNILSGNGITQPTLGFNQRDFTVDAKIPVPLTRQAPLYPVLIALVGLTGFSAPSSALFLTTAAYAVIFLLTYKLTRALYDQNVGLIALCVLLFYAPLRAIAHGALSDIIAIAFAFLSLWLLVRDNRKSGLFTLMAGVAVGLTLATRWALFPLLGAEILFLLIERVSWRRKFVDSFLLLLGFSIPAGIVWIRNLLLSGSVMPIPQRYGFHVVQNLTITGRLLFEEYAGTSRVLIQAGLFAASVILFCAILAAKHGFFKSLRDLFVLNRRYLLLCWFLAYLASLIFLRGPVKPIEERYVIPAGVTMIVLWSALAGSASGSVGRYIRFLFPVLLMFAIGREALVTKTVEPFSFHDVIQGSERLTWLANNTSDQDLIIGDDTMDIPFFLNRKAAVSFSAFHAPDRPTYEKVLGYSQKHCDEYRNIYLVLRAYSANEPEWRQAYGDFFADLVFGHLENYPEVILVRQLQDASIFRIVCR